MPDEPEELIEGRDVELVVAGVLSLVGAGAWIVVPRGPIDWRPVVIFVMMGAVSLGLAWWDISSRGDLHAGRDGDEP